MRRTSEILAGLIGDDMGERVSFAEILARLHGRSFGILLILIAAPNALPMPPGVSTVSAAGIAFVALQLLRGRRSFRLPSRLARRTIATATLARAITWLAPKLAWIERWSRPRAVGLTRLPARRFLGGLILVLALIMALPIPIVGNTPPAIAIVLIGFGMVERDGAVVGTGVGLALIDIAIIVGLGFGLLEAARVLLPSRWWPF